MKISLTGSGSLAEAYLKVNSSAEIFSFRKMKDEEIKDIILSSDVIIHNSGNIQSNDINELMNDNFGLTKRIIRLVVANKPNIKFINIGSMSFLIENGYSCINKMSPYAYSKFLSEIYVLMSLSNMKSVRFSTLFYKNPQRDGLSKLIYLAKTERKITLLNNGLAKRDFIPVNIAVQYLDYVIKNDTPQIINICSGIETSFLDVVNIISKHIDFETIFKTENTPEILSKFKRELPEIKFSLEDEIKKYICEL